MAGWRTTLNFGTKPGRAFRPHHTLSIARTRLPFVLPPGTTALLQVPLPVCRRGRSTSKLAVRVGKRRLVRNPVAEAESGFFGVVEWFANKNTKTFRSLHLAGSGIFWQGLVPSFRGV